MIEVYALSHVGKKRSKNQDNFICNNKLAIVDNNDYRVHEEYPSHQKVFIGVFDGMGGQLYGEKAAEIAAYTAKHAYENYHGENVGQFLESLCIRANQKICNEMVNTVKGRMGSTASMLFFDEDVYYICDLGDSPVFLIRDNKIEEISFEHTERQNYEQIFGDNYDKTKKFKLTQHLGIFPTEMEISPYINQGQFFSGDKFIICSDGLTDMVDKNRILEIVVNCNSIKDAGEKLLQEALDNGGKDNVTIIISEAKKQNCNKTNNAVIKNKRKKAPVVALILALIVTVIIFSVFFFNSINNNDKHGATSDEAKPTSTSTVATTRSQKKKTSKNVKNSKATSSSEKDKRNSINNSNSIESTETTENYKLPTDNSFFD